MMPRYLIDPSYSVKTYPYSDCIIIGSGIAGLSTAIRLSKHNIKVLTKSSPSDSTTWYAQGGIAAAIKKPDEWKKHYEDTLIAGQGLSDEKAVEILVKNAPSMIEKLIEIGTKFDITGGEISLTTEGGHSHARVLHAGGDATGEEIEKKLVSFTRELEQVNFKPNYFVLDILTNSDKCIGVIGLDLSSRRIEIHPSSNVLIASGGVGQIYELSTNPPISTGDGIAMAYRAGAEIMDIEFVQFHPTVFRTNDKKLFLISEALRGEGAYLRDCTGKRFMTGKHPQKELAPRDIVVKEMIKTMDKSRCNFVYLDATHIPESHLKIRFPNIIFKLKENNLDLTRDLIKVSPAEHYLNGGIRTGYDGRTNIEGLYSCGETAATGAHGANRLASNSLMEGLVYGWKIYRDIEDRLKSKTSKEEKLVLSGVKDISKESVRSLNENSSPHETKLDILTLVSSLRNMMSRKVGILRNKSGLEEAREFVQFHIGNENLYNRSEKDIIEFANMLTVANLIVKSAAIREESRGTHMRFDFPDKDDKNWKKHIILKKDKVLFKKVG
jgi:L-aspartate oxidase